MSDQNSQNEHLDANVREQLRKVLEKIKSLPEMLEVHKEVENHLMEIPVPGEWHDDEYHRSDQAT